MSRIQDTEQGLTNLRILPFKVSRVNTFSIDTSSKEIFGGVSTGFVKAISEYALFKRAFINPKYTPSSNPKKF